jgi:hypothetical protein
MNLPREFPHASTGNAEGRCLLQACYTLDGRGRPSSINGCVKKPAKPDGNIGSAAPTRVAL